MKKLLLLLALASLVPATHTEKKEEKVVIVSTPEQHRVLVAMWLTAIGSIWWNRHIYDSASPALVVTQPLTVQPVVAS